MLKVKEALNEAMRKAQTMQVEHGGWIFWNRNTGKIATLIKEPKIDPLNLKESDTYFQVFLNNPPPPPKGWEIIGTFHTHLENLGPNDVDEEVENSRKVPGIVITPDGKTWVYGTYKRGVWKRGLSRRCRSR